MRENRARRLPSLEYMPPISSAMTKALDIITGYRPLGLIAELGTRMPSENGSHYSGLDWKYETGEMDIRCSLSWDAADLTEYEVKIANGYVPTVSVNFGGTNLSADKAGPYAAAFSAVVAFATQLQATLRGRYDYWYAETCRHGECMELRPHDDHYCPTHRAERDKERIAREAVAAEEQALVKLREQCRTHDGYKLVVKKEGFNRFNVTIHDRRDIFPTAIAALAFVESQIRKSNEAPAVAQEA